MGQEEVVLKQMNWAINLVQSLQNHVFLPVIEDHPHREPFYFSDDFLHVSLKNFQTELQT